MSKAFQVGEVKGVVVSHQVGQVCLLNTFTWPLCLFLLIVVDSSSVKRERPEMITH
jgi:hypothetical protein